MKPTYIKLAFGLSLCGTLFAGYLSIYKIVSATCAFNEPCPYFLGYPSCWYGFAMFAAMLLVSTLSLISKRDPRVAARDNAIVSFLGILFAGNFTWQEVSVWMGGGASTYSLGLPTCAYGLIFYVAIFVASIIFLRRKA
jgi:hypothetical protein